MNFSSSSLSFHLFFSFYAHKKIFPFFLFFRRLSTWSQRGMLSYILVRFGRVLDGGAWHPMNGRIEGEKEPKKCSSFIINTRELASFAERAFNAILRCSFVFQWKFVSVDFTCVLYSAMLELSYTIYALYS